LIQLPEFTRLLIQHAGPKLATYSISKSATAIQNRRDLPASHISGPRRLFWREFMPAFYPGGRSAGKRDGRTKKASTFPGWPCRFDAPITDPSNHARA
jgi:hypothetical protein